MARNLDKRGTLLLHARRSMRTVGTIVGVLSAGCGSVDDDSMSPSGLPCDLSKPFADVRQLSGINSSTDEAHGTFSGDELTIYYFRNRMTGNADFDIYTATRANRDEPFGPSAALPALNTGADERGGSLSADGLTLFFYSSRLNGYEVYVSVRPNREAPFPEPVAISSIGTADHEQNPFITADGKYFYFTRTPLNTGISEIYRATTSPTGITNAMGIPEIKSFGGATRPVLSADNLTIYFTSDHVGGLGSLDIWSATRASSNAAFEGFTNVASLNEGSLDFPDWISHDGCRIYFTSARTSGTGGWDLWQATRPL